MALVIEPHHAPPAVAAPFSLRDAWPWALGLAALLVPTCIRFSGTIWEATEQSHTPIMLAIAAFLFWHKRAALRDAVAPAVTSPGWILIVLGLLSYVFGAWMRVAVMEAGAHLLLLTGCLWLIGGAKLIRAYALALLFFALFIPIPGFLLSIATGGLKQFVSASADTILYGLGYPIGRTGVMLTIGHYQLLVADACSGMNSIISLSALGLLYLYLIRPKVRWHGLVIGALILPIAIATNIIRVIVLVLVTYYLGDEAGQGFIHEFAGMLMFFVALGALFGVDALLNGFSRKSPQLETQHA